jgi:large conductance mechanosensitive channel
MSMIKEFKDFAMRGNLVDLAVAFVMGAAFSKLVSAFVDGIVMPLVGLVTAGVDFTTLKFVLREAQIGADGAVSVPETAITYGQFITVTLDFVIVAFVMFLLVKAVNKTKKKQEAPAPAGPTPDQQLLAEIRDLLKK